MDFMGFDGAIFEMGWDESGFGRYRVDWDGS
jgi:hypothetical protein